MRTRTRQILPALALIALFMPVAHAQQDYRTVDGPRMAADPEAVEVIEFFWYGCPHCYNFEPMIGKWKQDLPDDVTFRYVPAVFSPQWELHGRAFYAAGLMGVLDRFHGAMFAAIHEQGRRLDSAESIGEFVAELDIDSDKFLSVMDSFAVNVKIQRARSLQKRFGISGTPSLVVDGRFVISPGRAGSLEDMISVLKDRVSAALTRVRQQ